MGSVEIVSILCHLLVYLLNLHNKMFRVGAITHVRFGKPETQIYIWPYGRAEHNAPVICNPLPLPPPTYGDGRGIAELMCGAMIF